MKRKVFEVINKKYPEAIYIKVVESKYGKRYYAVDADFNAIDITKDFLDIYTQVYSSKLVSLVERGELV